MSDPSLPQTETHVIEGSQTGDRLSRRFSQKLNPKGLFSKARLAKLGVSNFGHVLIGTCALAAGLMTANQANLAALLECHAQTLFFDIRGPVELPKNASGEDAIVILSMDDTTMTQGTEVYAANPQQYPYFAPIARWPWQRTVYAIAIDRLMQAGARAVVLDVVLDAPSGYGPDDDQQLQSVLKKYPGRVALATKYESDQEREGDLIKPLLPNQTFRDASPMIGFINFPLNPDGRIHKLASEYPKLEAQNYPDNLAKAFLRQAADIPSLAESALKAAQQPYPWPKGQDIFFYGPSNTFNQVPFWWILEPTNWKVAQQERTFKDKIVLIGPTAGGGIFQDFHVAPFSGSWLNPTKMAGIEIQANAIATLLENKSIAQAIPNLFWQGGFVCVLVLAAGILQTRTLRPLRRFVLATAIALTWGGLSYVVFVQQRLVLPTAVPMLAIFLSGSSYLFTGVMSEKFKLRRAVRKFANSPAVQELVSVSQQSDLQPLIEEHHQEIIGRRLGGRYVIVRDLASGGFGKTYIAEDTLRPGNPLCVVKRLRPASSNPKVMKLAQELFDREAKTLEKLGRHNQIPQLLAYINEDEEFYLVQEYIEGKALIDELSLGNLLGRLPERKVVAILQELLQILEFVHQQGVIHRDIKPGNIIRRQSDNKLVLIDFGAVKQLKQLVETETEAVATKLTVAIGTDGFMAPEQADGKPCFGSDIYSIGITGIQALTGISVSKLKDSRDSRTAELQWKDNAQVSHTLAEILDRMVCYNFTERYQSATEALEALKPLTNYAQQSLQLDDLLSLPHSPADLEESEVDETRPWPETFS